MIIFDLDGTLADCEHRRHFVVDPADKCHDCYLAIMARKDVGHVCTVCGSKPVGWKADFQAFNEACDEDKPIYPVCDLYSHYFCTGDDVHIWSGRCESVRQKTIDWIFDNILTWIDPEREEEFRDDINLKMRPIGDNTPDEILKERWLDETYEETKWGRRTPIEFVFDDRPKVVRMWRRRGVFVFNCCQNDMEF